MPQRTFNNLHRKTSFISIFQILTNYVFQHSLISRRCPGPMTTVEPHTLCNGTASQRRGSLWGTDHATAQALKKHSPVHPAVSSLPGHCLEATLLSPCPTDLSCERGMYEQKALPEGAHRGHWWTARQMLCGLCWAQWGRRLRAFSASHHCNCWGF